MNPELLTEEKISDYLFIVSEELLMEPQWEVNCMCTISCRKGAVNLRGRNCIFNDKPGTPDNKFTCYVDEVVLTHLGCPYNVKTVKKHLTPIVKYKTEW